MSHATADLTGRVCLITGGAQGIGWALSRLLAARGARVLAADISDENLDRAAHELAHRRGAGSITLDRLDVTDQRALRQWICAAHAEHDRLDLLVNNAAFVRWASVEQMTVAEAELSMRTGFDAMVYGVKAVLPVMRAQGRGHIVNLGSSAGRLLVKGPSAAYAATKAAIEAYTEILRLELRGTPIHITLIRPGLVAGTQFFSRHVPSHQLPRLVDFLPAATADHVAAVIARGIARRRPTVDIPWFLPALYHAYHLSPRLFRRLADIGGPSRRNYAAPRKRDFDGCQ